MVAIVVLVSLQIPTLTCDLGYIVVLSTTTQNPRLPYTGYYLHYSNLAPVVLKVDNAYPPDKSHQVYIADITWWREDMNFIFEWQNNIS